MSDVPMTQVLPDARANRHPSAVAACETNTARRTVRILRKRRGGFVEFEFSMGDPDVSLEMILPEDAFRAFCREHRVRFLPKRREHVDRD